MLKRLVKTLLVKCSRSSWVDGKPMPTIVCNFEHECGKFSAVSVPNTGATNTCVNACLLFN